MYFTENAFFIFMLFIWSHVHICTLHAPRVFGGKRVWLQKPGLTQEHIFSSQSSKQFHTFWPAKLIAKEGWDRRSVGVEHSVVGIVLSHKWGLGSRNRQWLKGAWREAGTTCVQEMFACPVLIHLIHLLNRNPVWALPDDGKEQSECVKTVWKLAFYLAALCAAIARHWNLLVPVWPRPVVLPHSGLLDRLTDGCQWTESRLAASKTCGNSEQKLAKRSEWIRKRGKKKRYKKLKKAWQGNEEEYDGKVDTS